MNRHLARLEAATRDYIARLETAPIGGIDDSVAQQRARYRAHCAAMRAPRPPGVVVRDSEVTAAHGAIPIRTYRGAGSPGGTLLYLHGGGWVVGDLDSHDDICAEIALHTGAAVVAAHYRLAPEHPYPAAFDDAFAVLCELRAGAGGGQPLVVAGDSAGGNLAAALACKVRDAGLAPLAGQVLIYPGLAAEQSLPAYTELHDAPLLNSADVAWYLASYLAGQPADTYAAPLLAGDCRGLAPLYAIAAEVDPLRDDAREYARRLAAAGVAAQCFVAPGLAHSFLRIRHHSAGAGDAFRRILAAIRGMFAAA